MITKNYVQRSLVYGWKDYRLEWGLNLGPLDQSASAEHTELPGVLILFKVTLFDISLSDNINFYERQEGQRSGPGNSYLA